MRRRVRHPLVESMAGLGHRGGAGSGRHRPKAALNKVRIYKKQIKIVGRNPLPKRFDLETALQPVGAFLGAKCSPSRRRLLGQSRRKQALKTVCALRTATVREGEQPNAIG